MMTENVNLQNLVESFQESVNRKDVDKVLTMFTEDAEFELVGISKYSGKEQIKNQFDYDAGVNGELKFTDFRSEENTVHCQLTERNDRLAAMGINELTFPSCTFVFQDGLIQSFSAKVSPEMVQHNTEVWQKFIPWCKENHPHEYSKMFTSEGRFIYNRENGAGVVLLLRKWGERQNNK
ncbi:MAG TPA: nuclear transport factor 2 family protein [Balneolales bacterium]|nr:nuclear transport factor 2 family protein [Balneolales bacterium]